MENTYRIEVYWRGGEDGRVTDLLDQIEHLGIQNVARARISNLVFLRGNLRPEDIERIAIDLLVDPIVEGFRWQPVVDTPPTSNPTTTVRVFEVEVGFHPGVTDPVATHLLHRTELIGIEGLEAVTTGTRYELEEDPATPLTTDEVQRIAEALLCNEVIQSYTLGKLQPTFVPNAAPSGAVEIVPIRELSAEGLTNLSVSRILSLSLPEMQAIQSMFRELSRDPTDVELETLAQTWSEHCLHKTFRAEIAYYVNGGLPRVSNGDNQSDGEVEIIPGLLDTYLRSTTEQLAKPWVLSAFIDNAGIVDFDGAYELSFKAETHNHPSALEPFGGANTGVGGVIRDIIGVSARPIANTDVLCFAPPDMPPERIPDGTLHPRRIARGVIAGIEDYGNKMGIPTVAGAILYDEDYVANPLVYCGCVGIAPKGIHRRHPNPGDCIVALGGRTGRDGLHGATFSSAELTHETGQTVGSVVQIGDPITEKAVLDAVIQARDEALYTAITDCGAGGFSSSVGEMGEDIGVDVNLARVPLKYPGLKPWEIWLSEAQERMVIAVPEENLHRLSEICATYDVEWTVIGRFTGNRRLHLRYGDRTIADLPMAFVHDGWPKLQLQATWAPPALPAPLWDEAPTMTALLLQALAHPDVASKERVIRRYDHEVQGATVGKPITGIADDGPADAAVLHPLMTGGMQGIALGCGINPHYGEVDPYAMAWATIDEALRNVVCVGADPDRVALLDNFCWGNPSLPDRLGGLVRAAQGCHDAALTYGTPFISGKDSLNNEFVDAQGNKRTIPPTLLISSLGIVPDIRDTMTMALKHPGNHLYIVGETRRELGGSLIHRLAGGLAGAPPAPVPEAPATFRALHRAIRDGLVRALHDLSEGGLAVAAAEMCIAGRLGLDLDLEPMPRTSEVTTDIAALFAESNSRFLAEVSQADKDAFEQALDAQPFACLGQVTRDPRLRIKGLTGTLSVDEPVRHLVSTWQSADTA